MDNSFFKGKGRDVTRGGASQASASSRRSGGRARPSTSAGVDSEGSTTSVVVKGKKRRPPPSEAYGSDASMEDASSGDEYLGSDESDRQKPKKKKKRADTLPSLDYIRRELQELDPSELADEIVRQLEEVEFVAARSTNLKGTFIRKLLLAARTARVATHEQKERVLAKEKVGKKEVENAILVRELEEAREENRRLQARLGEVLQKVVGGGGEEAKATSSSHSSPAVPAGGPSGSAPRVLVERADMPPPLTFEGKVGQGNPRIEGYGPARAVPPAPAPAWHKAIVQLEGRMEAKLERLQGSLDRLLLSGTALPAEGSSPAGAGAIVAPALIPSPLSATVSREAGDVSRARPEGMGVDKGESRKRRKGGSEGCPAPPPPQQDERVVATPQGLGGPTTGDGRPAAAKGTWATVVGRRAKAGGSKDSPAGASSSAKTTKKDKAGPEKRKKLPPAPPKTAAVALTVVKQGASLGDALADARKKVSLAGLGIAQIRTRHSATGGILLEIPGTEAAEKADALAAKLVEVLTDKGIKVGRPVRTAELRVTGLDESIALGEVVTALAEEGGCSPQEIKPGVIKRAASGMGVVWARCPLGAARKLAVSAGVRVGWTRAKVEVLALRPLQCYKCLQTGHVRAKCKAAVDRSDRCFRCGTSGHVAAACTQVTPKCLLCADLGKPAEHRLGGAACSSKEGPGKGAQKKKTPADTAVPVAAVQSVSGGTDTPMEIDGAGPSREAASVSIGGTRK